MRNAQRILVSLELRRLLNSAGVASSNAWRDLAQLINLASETSLDCGEGTDIVFVTE